MRLRTRSIALLLTLTTVFATTWRTSLSSSKDDRQQLDLLIVHGKLVDGSGKKPRKADIGIRGDRIVFVGDARNSHVEAARTIDATGLIVAPGFIDPHTHTLGDLTNDQTKSNQEIRQSDLCSSRNERGPDAFS